MAISVDEAISVLVEALRKAPELLPTYDTSARPYGCDLMVEQVFDQWWGQQHADKPKGEVDYAPFHDAAWELARRGILRPGPAIPAHLGYRGNSTEGSGFSLTVVGHDWVRRFDQMNSLPSDPGRFAALIIPYAGHFGEAFVQRVKEANACYRTMNYLACCAMCGAACESILLALAIATSGDEAAALRNYRKGDGRKSLINQIKANRSGYLVQAIETATALLSYWRDSASHGHATEMTEFAAHDALSRLLRFSQVVSENWGELTK